MGGGSYDSAISLQPGQHSIQFIIELVPTQPVPSFEPVESGPAPYAYLVMIFLVLTVAFNLLMRNGQPEWGSLVGALWFLDTYFTTIISIFYLGDVFNPL